MKLLKHYRFEDVCNIALLVAGDTGFYGSRKEWQELGFEKLFFVLHKNREYRECVINETGLQVRSVGPPEKAELCRENIDKEVLAMSKDGLFPSRKQLRDIGREDLIAAIDYFIVTKLGISRKKYAAELGLEYCRRR